MDLKRLKQHPKAMSKLNFGSKIRAKIRGPKIGKYGNCQRYGYQGLKG